MEAAVYCDVLLCQIVDAELKLVMRLFLDMCAVLSSFLFPVVSFCRTATTNFLAGSAAGGRGVHGGVYPVRFLTHTHSSFRGHP